MARQRPDQEDLTPGRAELVAARSSVRPALFAAFVFSAFVNLLMLTAPLYMLQVYDRVLVSRSVETLVALSLLAGLLFVLMGVLDHARGRIMARIGATVQLTLDRRVQEASLARRLINPQDTTAWSAQSDLDALARLWASPALIALFDAPWTPIFLGAIFVFHPTLGWLALAGGAALIAVTLANEWTTKGPLAASLRSTGEAERVGFTLGAEVEVARALGMQNSGMSRWADARARSLQHGLRAADLSGLWTVVTRTLRLVLQSAMLGLAAWLVLRDQVSAGAMLAASVLMGRALQPVEQAIGHWTVVTRARAAHARLAKLLSAHQTERPRTALPRPIASVEIRDLTVQRPGMTTPVLRGVTLTVQPGQAVGVIGPSGSGKSTLALALSGALAPASGEIRLGGATLDQYDPEALGRLLGYLPQRPVLFDGTVAENIARLDPLAPADRILAAARAAAAHEMILRLPGGYDCHLTTQSTRLSGGQIQRLSLARALYNDPVLLVLDEPNANLDGEGALALNQAVKGAKARGAAVFVMAHRPAVLQECDLILVLKDGGVSAVGPRDEVLRNAVRNADDISRALAIGIRR